MATAYISEYKDIPSMHGGVLPIEPVPIATQVVTYTTSTASTAFNAETRWVRVNVDAIAHVAHDAAATANSPRYNGDTTTYIQVKKGGTLNFYDGTS